MTDPLKTLTLLSAFMGTFVLLIVIFSGILIYKVFKYDRQGYVERKVHTINEINGEIIETYSLETVVPTKIFGIPQRVGTTIKVSKEEYDKAQIGNWIDMKQKPRSVKQ